MTVPWMRLDKAKVGDELRSRGEWLPIIRIERVGKEIKLTYRDTDGKEKHVSAKPMMEYIIRRKRS